MFSLFLLHPFVVGANCFGGGSWYWEQRPFCWYNCLLTFS